MNKWVEDFLQKLNLVDDMDQPEGFSRLGYSDLETESIDVFKAEAERLGLTVREDQAGNVMARWEGTDEHLPIVSSGSHVDTVNNGGGYDGVAGVLCALGAVKYLKDEGFTPKHPVEVIVFRSEESARFGISTIGSKSMTGLLDLDIGSVKDAEGTTIQEAVESCGYEWNKIKQAERAKSELKSFLELHIEQGTHIEDHQKDFGVVRGIATPIRLLIKAIGQAGHTGTTPMHKRKDAFVAIAPLVSFVNEYTTKLNEEQDTPVVATVSTASVNPNAMNVIPGEVELGIDIRSVDNSLKERVKTVIQEKCTELGQRFGVEIEVEELVNNDSVLLDESLQEKLVSMGHTLGYEPHLMDSGAGHDVMNMATRWPSGLIFIPCQDGLSHHPAEHATIDDLVKGVHLISQYYKKEAGE